VQEPGVEELVVSADNPLIDRCKLQHRLLHRQRTSHRTLATTGWP
jgi:hypothetical protein